MGELLTPSYEMLYFKAPNGEVYGYDVGNQQALIAAARTNNWEDITNSWPPSSEPELELDFEGE